MRRLNRHHRVIASAVVIMGIAALSIVLWAYSGNKASLQNSPGANENTVKLTSNTLTDPHFSFKYSSIYRIGAQIPQPPDLANYMLTASTSYDKRMSVVLVSGDLSTTNAYLYRTSRSDIYSSQTVTLRNGGVASVWTKNDMSEVTAFIPNKGLVAIVSLSVRYTNAPDGLQAEMTDILSSFSWQ